MNLSFRRARQLGMGLLLGTILLSSTASIIAIGRIAADTRGYHHELNLQQHYFSELAYRLRSLQVDLHGRKKGTGLETRSSERHFERIQEILQKLRNTPLQKDGRMAVELVDRQVKRIRTLLCAYVEAERHIEHDKAKEFADRVEKEIGLSANRAVKQSRSCSVSMHRRVVKLMASTNYTVIVLLVGSTAAVLFGFGIATYLARRMSRHVKAVLRATTELGEGNLDYRIASPFQDEIGQICAGVDEMAERLSKGDGQLREANLDLRAANERLVHTIKRANQMAKDARESAEAKQSSKAKSHFLANMSHEIRTPMNGVMGMAELLLKTELSSQQKCYARAIYQSAESLLTIINDVLDFSKIEAERVELDIEPFDLLSATEDVAHLVGPLAKGRELEVVVRYDEDTPRWVVGDGARIRQILTNLVGNALKFTREGHVLIHVTCRKKSDDKVTVCIAVEDTGIGIAADQLEHIFGTFTQAHPYTARKFGGTGLGLAICESLTKMMDGRIKVTSELGVGSTFSVTLPLALAEAPASSALDLRELKGMSVLVVDDDEICRQVLEETLGRWQMKVVSVDSGATAVERVLGSSDGPERLDLMILDVNMPGMNGFEVMERIRQDNASAPGVVMMLTLFDHSAEAARCQELGVETYLVKPVRQAELLNGLLRVLGKAVAPAPERSSEAEAQEASGPQRRVLLAEDNIVNQEVAAGILRFYGHTVVVVGDGREAVAAVKAERFDMVFMDIQMPEMGGFQATHKIRDWEKQFGYRTPIVAMTAHAMKGDEERCLEEGMDGYLSKPISGEKVVAVMERILRPTDAGARAPEAALAEAPGVPEACRSEEAHDGDGEPEAGQPAVIDYEALLRRCVNKVSLARRVLSLFEGTAVGLAAQLEQSLAEGDLEEAAKKAHTLKGASANIAAGPLRAITSEVERLARSGAEAASRSKIPELKLELERCLELARDILSQPESAPDDLSEETFHASAHR